jgi:nucleoside-diphosphate-sugar epimerase
VLAVGRRAAPDRPVTGGAKYVAWDLAGPSGPPVLPRGFREPDAVVHCAGLAADWARPRAYHRGNVATTTTLLAAFPGVARFVHISSASVYDPRVPTVQAREHEADGVRLPDAYGRSKAEAELCVRRARPDAVILRPHAVYGPGDTTLMPRILRAVRNTPMGPRLFAVGDGRQRLSLTGIGNLADACLLALAARASGTFNIADQGTVTMDEALRRVLGAHGIPALPVYLPLGVALPMAAAAQAAARLRPAGRSPRLTIYAVRHLAHERTLDLTAAREQLGYRPGGTDLGSGLEGH